MEIQFTNTTPFKLEITDNSLVLYCKGTLRIPTNNHVLNTGIFIYNSSDYIMCIRGIPRVLTQCFIDLDELFINVVNFNSDGIELCHGMKFATIDVAKKISLSDFANIKHMASVENHTDTCQAVEITPKNFEEKQHVTEADDEIQKSDIEIMEIQESKIKIELDRRITMVSETYNQFLHGKEIENINKKIRTVKNNRIYLLPSLGYFEYIRVVKGQYDLMMSSKIVPNSVKKPVELLTTLELRLLEINNAYQTHLDPGEASQFSALLLMSDDYYKTSDLKIFNEVSVHKYILSYVLAFYPIEKIITMALFFNNKNVIYALGDRETFYRMVGKTKSTLFWNSDPNLHKLSTELIEIILPQCVLYFRKMYHDVYHHNDYIDFHKKHTLPSIDMEGKQLIRNILYLSNYAKFNAFLKEIVRKHGAYEFTCRDSANEYKDQSGNSCKADFFNESRNNIRALFDVISEENINTILKIFC